MLDLLKELRPGSGLTVHGFRSTFRDWVSDETEHDSTLAEIALAHRVGDQDRASLCPERQWSRNVGK